MEKLGNSYHVRLTNGCLVGVLGGCAREGTYEMKELLYHAAYSYTLNAFDVEFSVSNEFNHWDSNFGANYRFQFPQRNL